jgi:iron complex outermembrane receptor protein
MDFGSLSTRARALLSGAAFAIAASQGGIAHADNAAADQAAPAEAADAAGTSNSGDILVTARKRVERLQDVPLSVNALSSEELLKKGIRSLSDVADYTPGFRYTDFLTKFNGNPTIRGLAQNNPQAKIGNVGVFLDGIYLQRGYMVDSQLNDLERLEIVKGPQSALYGQNTFAGAINYVLRMPTNDFKVNMEGSLGNAGFNEFRVGVGGPIIKDVLMARVYYARSNYGGTWKNNFPGLENTDQSHFGSYKRNNFSATVLFKPIERLTIRGTYNRSERRDKIAAYYNIDGNNPEDKNNCGPYSQPLNVQYLWCGNLPTNVDDKRSGKDTAYYPSGLFTTIQPGMVAKTRMFHVSADYKLSDSLTLTYDYGNVHGTGLEESVLVSNSYMVAPDQVTKTMNKQREAGDLKYNSNEAKLFFDHGGPFKADAGVFRSVAHDSFIFGITQFPVGALTTLSSTDIFADNSQISITNQQTRYTITSGYLRGSYTLLDDRLTIAGEGRYANTKLRAIDLHKAANPPLTSSYNDFTPRATIQFKLQPQMMLYASAARGVKAGGFNGYTDGPLTLGVDEQSYQEEKNWTYEVGLKGDAFRHTLNFALSGFYIDWQNRQVPQYPAGYVPATTVSVGVGSIFTTAGTAKSYGVELTGNWQATPELTFNTAFTYQNATLGKSKSNSYVTALYCDDIVCNKNGDTSGNRLPYQPQVQASGGFEYRKAVRDDIEAFFGADEVYRGHTFTNDENTTGTAAYALTNMHLGVSKGPWQALFWGKNITNHKYVDAAFTLPTGLQNIANLGELRTYGITVSLNY